MAKIEISKSRLKSLLAAEEFCRAARAGYSTTGSVGKVEYRWFERWMRLSGMSRYDTPKEVAPVWCCECRCRHIAGYHKN